MMRLRLLGQCSAVIFVAAACAILLGPAARWFETPPSLVEILRLLNERNYDDAERGLRMILARKPESREANILMAQVLIDRHNPRPEAALDHLKRVRSRDAKTRALVLVAEGKALYQLRRMAQSEARWKEAITLDPQVAEAGWLLIQQYYLQGREEELRRLAPDLHATETDPVDRVRYLLELAREDVERLAAAGVIDWLEPAVKADPNDRASLIALGRALIKEGRGAEGFGLLSKAVADRPDDRTAWEALLNGLNDEGDVDRLAAELARLPSSLAADPRFDLFRGRVAQESGKYDEAAGAYARVLKVRPDDPKVLHRLARTLRLAGRDDEAARYAAREANLAAASKELKSLLAEVKDTKAAGDVAEIDRFHRFAALRERQGKADESLAWHRLVLRVDPADAASRAASERLAGPDVVGGLRGS